MAKKEKKNARSKNSEKKSLFSFFDILKKILMFVGSFVGILFVWSQVKAISGEPQASTVTKKWFFLLKFFISRTDILVDILWQWSGC